MEEIKCVIAGDGWVGKTCMLTAFSSETPATYDYKPTICENLTKSIEVDGRLYSLTLWDTASQECYEHLRTLSYRHADVFILVFSIGSLYSLENVSQIWVPEVQHTRPDACILLVGNKIDMRQQQPGIAQENSVSYDMGAAKAKEIKAKGYMECSALTLEGIKGVFQEAVRIVHRARELPTKKEKRCCLLL